MVCSKYFFHTNICLMPFISLVNNRVDNVLVRTAPELNQPLFPFIKAMDVCLINTLLHGRLYDSVVWMPQIHRNKVWRLYTPQFDSFVSTINCSAELLTNRCKRL